MEHSASPELDEFNGFTESNSSETANANTDITNQAPPAPNVPEALAALLESNRLMWAQLQSGPADQGFLRIARIGSRIVTKGLRPLSVS